MLYHYERDIELSKLGFSFIKKVQINYVGKTNIICEYLHHQTNMEFVQIPEGTFMMGCDEYQNESPIHRVTLSPFLMSKILVSQFVWQKIMGNNPSFFKKDDNCPVEQISWDDAQEFCKKTKLQLPTEAQWEYACRAGTVSKWYHGNDVNELEKYAWYAKNSHDQTHLLAQKKSNPFGLYDITGNICEWCEDWYGRYNAEEIIDPRGPESGLYKVFRGGSWCSGAGVCRSTNRIWDGPSIRSNSIGIRCVFNISK